MRKLILLQIIILTCATVYSQNPGTTGSLGFFHTHEGRTLLPGRWNFWANVNYWSQQAEYLGAPSEDFPEGNYKLIAANLAISYGIINHLDATLALRLYQETNHWETPENVPDDLFLTIKSGSFSFEQGHFAGALWATVRFPTGKVHNYPWAEYASGSTEYGFFGGISYYYNPFLTDQGVGLHFNFGWWNHNEKDREIDIIDATTTKATIQSQELKMNLAMSIPAGPLQFRVEIFGGVYTNIPDDYVYSAEDYAFVTPSVRYTPLKALSIDLGVDLRISPGDRQRTKGVPDYSNWLDLPTSYPPWKLQVGVLYSILPAGVKQQYGGAVDNIRIRKRLQFYEKVMTEKEKAANIEKDINKKKKAREDADEEIDKMKEELE